MYLMSFEIPLPAFKSGFVAVMGRPNVGKSTLINALLGQKITAVSPRPQTTRKRQMGILTMDNGQIIFIDTPGIHEARHKLGEYMNKEAADTLQESDVILWVVDVSQVPHADESLLANLVYSLNPQPPIILARNMVDKVAEADLIANKDAYLALMPGAEPVQVSATRGDNLVELVNLILDRLPVGEAYFPIEQITDLYEREISADLIREACLRILRDEIPHGIAIRIDQFTEREEHGAYIEATIFVEKESHKGIVIGKGGSMLKKIGSLARHEIESMSGRNVYLRLRVKVRKNWRDDDNVLRRFGW